MDARTEITTELLAEEGYSVMQENEDGELVEQTFFGKDFEKKFFSDETNHVFCETFLKNALRDPLSGEIGKTIIFCVRQDHATRIVQNLNEMAHALFPGKYNSDFAVQVTPTWTRPSRWPPASPTTTLTATPGFWTAISVPRPASASPSA